MLPREQASSGDMSTTTGRENKIVVMVDVVSVTGEKIKSPAF